MKCKRRREGREQHAWLHAFLVRDPMHILRERERVDPVKQLEERQGMPDLVLLQMPDEMPAQTGR